METTAMQENQDTKASASTTVILAAGSIMGLLLIAAAFIWPEARGILLAAGVITLFLGFALSQVTGMITRSLQVEKPKDQGLEITLQALREGLAALPAQLETGLIQGLGRHAETLGASLATDLKRSASEIEAALGHAREWIQSQSEAAHRASQQEISLQVKTWREAQAAAGEADRAALSNLTQQLISQVTTQFTAQFAAQVGTQVEKHMQLAVQNLASQHEKSLVQSVSGLRENLETALTNLAKATEAHGEALQKQALAAAEQATSTAQQSEALKAVTEAQGATLQALFESAQSTLTQTAEAMRQAQVEQGQAITAWQAQLADAATSASQEINKLTQAAVQEIATLVQQSQAALTTQTQAAETVAKTLVELGAETAKNQDALSRFETSAQINQVELQSGVAMLNSALGNVLDRLEGQAQAGESHDAFLAKLESALAAYQERSGEILTENALKTQEILLEALQALERRAAIPVDGESPVV